MSSTNDRCFVEINKSCIALITQNLIPYYRGIHADVIVYIFAHLHTTLRTEENSRELKS